mgnify:CR=1 FL=1
MPDGIDALQLGLDPYNDNSRQLPDMANDNANTDKHASSGIDSTDLKEVEPGRLELSRQV